MGTLPRSPYASSAARPSFPWSHQPLSGPFDWDPYSGVVTFSTKHCVFAIFVVLPGFACAPGRVNPEPGRGDLLDPRHQTSEVEIPESLADLRSAWP